MAPSRKRDIAGGAIRAMIAGTVACFMTACIAGIQPLDVTSSFWSDLNIVAGIPSQNFYFLTRMTCLHQHFIDSFKIHSLLTKTFRATQQLERNSLTKNPLTYSS